MKLLILGLILIGVLLVKIYYINKESFVDYDLNLDKVINDNDKLIKKNSRNYKIKSSIPGEQKIKKGVDFLYPVRIKEGYGNKLSLEEKPADRVIPKTRADTAIDVCNSISSCDALPDSNPPDGEFGCGYCAKDVLGEVPNTGQGFSYGDENNTIDDVQCKKDQWTRNKKECQYLTAKQQCARVTDCGDLINGLEEICGWCPTLGIALPKNPGSDTLMYPEQDKCPSSGIFEGGKLLTKDKCGSFLNEHPCITPYHKSGPHTGKCVQKLWKLSGCKPEGLKKQATDVGMTVNDFTDKLGKNYGIHPYVRSYEQVGLEFTKMEKLINNNNYETAKDASEYCLGDSKKLDPCDSKYNKNGIPHPECLKKKYLNIGCTEKGTGYKNLKGNSLSIKYHIKDVNKYNKKQMLLDSEGNVSFKDGGKTTSIEEYNKNLSSLQQLTTDAIDYPTRLKTSKICYGKVPEPPPGIKKGDTVFRIINNIEYDGIVTDLRKVNGRKAAQVMWYERKYKSPGGELLRTVKRKNQTDDEKKWFGWPGVSPSHNSSLIEKDGWINISKLRIRESCTQNASSCKETCKDKINNIMLKYPAPLDCVQSEWSSWSNCSKSCNSRFPDEQYAGIKTKTRKTIFNAQYGGKPCGSLKETKRCGNKVCLDKSFKPLNMPKLKEKFTNVKEGLLGKCEGDCNRDSDCKSGLVCWQRDGNDPIPVPGCSNKEKPAKSSWDYCVDKQYKTELKSSESPPEWVKGQRYGWRGQDYRGKRNWTKTGRTCQKWTENSNPHSSGSLLLPKKCITAKGASASRPCRSYVSRWNWCGGSSLHKRTAVADCTKWWKLANAKGLGNHNYCRNPDGEEKGVWCYTTDRNRRWEYCN
jgi:hypothetical protein